MRGRGKGASFEREIAKKLSEWWSKRGDDDLFWRTQASGARATTRRKKGKKTRGQHLDICCTDGRGKKLLKFAVISTKRGYQNLSIQDIIDRVEDRKSPEIENWFTECYDAKKEAGSVSWMLILKKNRRETLLFIPLETILFKFNYVIRNYLIDSVPNGFISIRRRKTRRKIKKMGQDQYITWFLRQNKTIFCMNFQKFLDIVERDHIEEIVRKYYSEDF